MPTYSSTKISKVRPLIRISTLASPLEGEDGKKVVSKIQKLVLDSESENLEPIHRLVHQLEQLYLERSQRLQAYLDSLHVNSISQERDDLLEYVWQIWVTLRDIFNKRGLCLEVPDACPGENEFIYVWSKGEHYLECEVFIDESVEFFYKNCSTLEIWGEDTKLEDGFSSETLEKLSIFSW